jgi:hypothetical protein
MANPLDQVRDRVRVLHYSIRAADAYVPWIKRFILFHGKRHLEEMGAPALEAFLPHLAVDRSVAAWTRNQALSAILSRDRKSKSAGDVVPPRPKRVVGPTAPDQIRPRAPDPRDPGLGPGRRDRAEDQRAKSSQCERADSKP